VLSLSLFSTLLSTVKSTQPVDMTCTCSPTQPNTAIHVELSELQMTTRLLKERRNGQLITTAYYFGIRNISAILTSVPTPKSLRAMYSVLSSRLSSHDSSFLWKLPWPLITSSILLQQEADSAS